MQISDAMARFPKVFSPLYIAMVRVGEVGGGLSNTLQHLSSVLESQAEIRARIKTALTYPIILSVVAVIIVTFLLAFVMPRFLDIFTEAGVELPSLTRNVMFLSSWIRNRWYIVVAVIAGVIGFYKYYTATEKGRYNIDNFKLKIPVVGELIRKMSISRFTRIFGTLMGKGVPVLETLDVVHETISNAVMKKVIEDVQASVRTGRNISAPLEESGVIPPMVVQVVRVGEESGEIEQVSNELSNFFDKEVDRTISRFVTIVEPLMIIIVGGVVALLVFSCILPMFDMMRVYR
jgi:type IV pilus assembly protein PilC